MSMKRIQIAIQRISENCCVGIFEVDDLIQNAWGPCVGCCLGNMWMNCVITLKTKKGGQVMKNNIIKNMYSIVSCLVILGGCCIVSMLQ